MNHCMKGRSSLETPFKQPFKAVKLRVLKSVENDSFNDDSHLDNFKIKIAQPSTRFSLLIFLVNIDLHMEHKREKYTSLHSYISRL